jgi:para-aminobenzoate synthetase/4-amino-4-deoxychorismate lyase
MSRWHSLPAELYALVENTPATVLLETSKPSAPGLSSGSCSRLFTAPLRVLVAGESADLPNLFAEIESAVALGHYAAGFFSYECGHFFEPTVPTARSRPGQSLPAAETLDRTVDQGFIPGSRATESLRALAPESDPWSVSSADCPSQPLAWFGIYKKCYLFDHHQGAFPSGDPPGIDRFRPANSTEQPLTTPQIETTLALTEEQYAGRVAAIHEWIRAGDVYQLNFTVPMQIQAPGSAAALYQRLRCRQPVPFGAFLHCRPGHRILSFSPELFFNLEEQESSSSAPTRRITTRPMKGTAPRGRTTREDDNLADWLQTDKKNRSENVMIVDLLRNDLGRLCAYGSVQAENLFAVERYPTLLQMTSTVTGDLRPDVSLQQIFRALFPCGSITGAPKVRAMQLIANLEDQPRGVYTGAIGFFSRRQSVFNVAIRTLELDGESGAMGIGSGVVIDSDPSGEFRECLLKAEFLTRSSNPRPDRFSLVETLLWNGEFPLIELHLERLEDSASYFGFPCDRATAKAALLAHAASLVKMPGAPGHNSETREISAAESSAIRKQDPPEQLGAPSMRLFSGAWVGSQESQSAKPPRKVRLLLDYDGGLQIESELLPEPSIARKTKPLRVRFSTQRTDPQDPMYFHKTTHRPLYAAAFKAAVESGLDDVLFLNLRGEVTEGAIHNIFIEKDGCLITPPVESGLLAGVHRRHLLETQPLAIERVLYPEDLRQADAVYLSNAVRGLRPAVIDWKDEPGS